tara:strand:+ start:122 stop:1261 length:1140 start_codon:yes stop_codon:yes gene_type:complete
MKIFPTALILIFALTVIYLISTMYQKPLSSWFAKEGDHYHKHFILAQGDENFTCETSDSFIEVKYFGEGKSDIVLNEWKDYKKEGEPLFTVNSKTGVLQQLRGGTGICWTHNFVFLKDGEEMSLFEHGACGKYSVDYLATIGPIENDSKNKECYSVTYLKKPLEENTESFKFDIKYDEDNPLSNYNFYGKFTPLESGPFGYLSGSVKMTFKLKDDYDWKYATIEIAKNFALPPLKGRCKELYDDDYEGDCRIETPIWLDAPGNDLLTYEPVRIFDIDFDGDDEIVIGTIGGNRLAHEYQIFELEFEEDSVQAIPTISFRGDAEINKEFKTLTTRNDSDVCTSSVTTYQSDGTGFKVIKKVENGYFEEAYPNKCITRIIE